MPADPWDAYLDAWLQGEVETGESERPVVRSRLVLSAIWFVLAIMPARERWLGWLLDRPHAVVETYEGEIGEILPSLPSRP